MHRVVNQKIIVRFLGLKIKRNVSGFLGIRGDKIAAGVIAYAPKLQLRSEDAGSERLIFEELFCEHDISFAHRVTGIGIPLAG